MSRFLVDGTDLIDITLSSSVTAFFDVMGDSMSHYFFNIMVFIPTYPLCRHRLFTIPVLLLSSVSAIFDFGCRRLFCRC